MFYISVYAYIDICIFDTGQVGKLRSRNSLFHLNFWFIYLATELQQTDTLQKLQSMKIWVHTSLKASFIHWNILKRRKVWHCHFMDRCVWVISESTEGNVTVLSSSEITDQWKQQRRTDAGKRSTRSLSSRAWRVLNSQVRLRWPRSVYSWIEIFLQNFVCIFLSLNSFIWTLWVDLAP